MNYEITAYARKWILPFFLKKIPNLCDFMSKYTEPYANNDLTEIKKNKLPQ